MTKDMEAKNETLKRIYTTVFCQCFSPCGKYLAACDNYGQISVFHVDVTEPKRAPMHFFQAFDGPVYSLISTEKFLIAAGTGHIRAFEWTEIIQKTTKVSWSLSIPNGNNYAVPEANCMVLSKEDHLYAGCGDNQVHMWDLDSGKLLNSMKGHTNYVHDVDLWQQNKCVSASEDGAVIVWDERTGCEPNHVIKPYENDRCCRPNVGRFLTCVSVDSSSDWLICGGGPKMSLWHLQSQSCTTVFETSQNVDNFVKFHDDGIVSGGSAGKVEYWNIDGSVKAQVPCKPKNVFNICVNEGENHMLSVAGSGAQMDVYMSVAYSAFSLQVR